jgi:signal transduction histidine kinase
MVRSKDGTPIAIEVRTALIKDATGRSQYFLSVIRDIRERKEAEKQEKIQQEKLIQADKMISLGTLVTGIAHEINTPLASIKMNSEIFDRVWHDVVPVFDEHYKRNKDFTLESFPYSDAKKRLKDLLTGLIESSKSIENIINNLRDYSRPGDSSTRGSTDINKVLIKAVNLTHNLIKKSTNNFSLLLEENLPHMRGNSQELQQVFINLIQNACQALTSNTGKIEISTVSEKKKNKILIKVKDEGEGILEKDKKYIIDPFYTTRRDKGGTGLGLFISMKIIHDHKGNIEFHSEKGKGTTVTVSLPVYE